MKLIEFPGRRGLLGLSSPRWSKVVVSWSGVAFHKADTSTAFSWDTLLATTIREGSNDSITDDWHMEFSGDGATCRLDYEDLDDDNMRRLIELVKARIPARARLELPGAIKGRHEGAAKAARSLLKSGEIKQAEHLMLQSLAENEQKFGAHDPYVAFALETYAIVLSRSGREEQASAMRQRASAIRANPWQFF
jgi:hypothetical protein